MTIRYIIEVIICSGLFMVIYRWLLARKVGFRLCRAFIVTSMFLAAAIPAMNIPLYPERTVAEQTVMAWPEFFGKDPDGAGNAGPSAGKEISGTAATGIVPGKEHIDIKAVAGTVVNIVYILVVLASLGLTAYNIIKIQRLRRRSRLTQTEDYTLAEHDEIKTPFSFLLTIFMGFNYEPHERSQILTHEASHIRHRHSFERLALSVLRSFFWFNPFFRLAEKDLEEVQEWEADKDVLGEGYELDTYRRTIFKQLFGYNPDISCGLNHSLTKQRFIMMTQSHRGKGAWIRLTATLPVIAAVFLAFGCGTKETKASDTATDPAPLLTSDNPVKAPLRIHVMKEGDKSVVVCNGKRVEISGIGQIVAEYFAGEEMHYANVSISADDDVAMGVITDIKEQLRNARALKVRYETDDSAIEKRLPPARSNPMVSDDPFRAVNRRNIIVIRVNPDGEMFLGDTYLKGSLHDEGLYRQETERLKALILNPENNAKQPDSEMRDILMPDGSTRQFRVSKGMVSFQNDIETSYEDYTKAMSLITTAYKEIREELSAETFGKSLADLSDEEMQVIYQAVPMNVSEAEPKNAAAYR